jgi:16S rRNA (cytosine967-C5)-methyltransferase
MNDTHSARACALKLLAGVLGRARPLDEVFAAALKSDFEHLGASDRAFARLLAATVLRRLGEIDAVLGRCLERPLAGGAPRIHDILRLGVAQLLFLQSAPHAAVDTAVELASSHPRLQGLVNAVLRRVAREGTALSAKHDSARLDTPEWLWRSWESAYGAKAARGIAEAHLAEPTLDLVVKEAAEDWAARLEATVLPTGGLRRAGGGRIEELPGYGEGAWWVQDAAAALPVRLLGAVAGRTVLDLCAAPGGKTAQLAQAGARVIALDRSAPRLARLAANMERLGLTAEPVEADVLNWRPETPAEAILLDAPCSATGTIRRHPDIQRLKAEADIAGLARNQARLVAAAAEMLAPGGVLVYCVCSLQPEEGEAVIDALLALGAPLERVPVEAAEVGGMVEFITAAGDLRTLPCHWPELGGLDGFYAARLRRKG